MPRTTKKVFVGVYLDEEDTKVLDKLAKMEGISRSAVLRKLLRKYSRKRFGDSS